MQLHSMFHLILKTGISIVVLAAISGHIRLNAQSLPAADPARPEFQHLLKRMFLVSKTGSLTSRIVDGGDGNVSIMDSKMKHIVLSGKRTFFKKSPGIYSARLLQIIEPGQLPGPSVPGYVDADSVLNHPGIAFSLFPNPIDKTQREIGIDLEKSDHPADMTMYLCDALGRVISRKNLIRFSGKQTLALPSLMSGKYYIILNENGKSYSKAMVVK